MSLDEKVVCMNSTILVVGKIVPRARSVFMFYEMPIRALLLVYISNNSPVTFEINR